MVERLLFAISGTSVGSPDSLAEFFAAHGEKEIKSVFSGGVYVGKHTLRPASVRRPHKLRIVSLPRMLESSLTSLLVLSISKR